MVRGMQCNMVVEDTDRKLNTQTGSYGQRHKVEDREIKFRTEQDMCFAELILVHYLDWHFWMAVCFVLFVCFFLFVLEGFGERGGPSKVKCEQVVSPCFICLLLCFSLLCVCVCVCVLSLIHISEPTRPP